MRPLTVITGIVLGTSASIAISLLMVLIVFFLLGDDYPRLEHEFEALTASLVIFLGMTIVSAGSFYAMVIRHRLRLAGQALMWLGVLATGWYYWP